MRPSQSRYHLGIAAAGLLLAAGASAQASAPQSGPFQRIASFPVFLNTSAGATAVAEIVTSANNGNLLIYTDSQQELLGFIDIVDPADPQPAGTLALDGEPTSVSVKGGFALVCVDTSADYVNTSGELVVVDVNTRQVVRTLQLGGQPDSIAISPNGRFAAIAIENERDEELGSGAPPQLPAGFVVIVDLNGAPANWSMRNVDLVGVADLFPEDPEPEFVDINAANVAAVTLQENNHVVLIHLPTGQIVKHFPAGSVDLSEVDTQENDLIEQTGSLSAVPREPDAVVWTSPLSLATANEGDLDGGSRGYTHWSVLGQPLHDAGNTLEHAVARHGHYPEDRSENKGCEPEGAEFARFGQASYLFVGSERSNVVAVYRFVSLPFFFGCAPRLCQLLPTGVAPEGLHAIPERNLFVVACEADDRADKIRSSVMIYRREGASNYPTVVSVDRAGSSLPIPWAALSGLAPDAQVQDRVYAIHDSFYRNSRIYALDVAANPAVIRGERVLVDSAGVLLSALQGLKAQLPGTDDFEPTNIVELDGKVNLDAEGIAALADGSFWLASEGTGNLANGVSNPNDRPFEAPNVLVRVAADGAILDAVLPPLEVTRNQFRFGYEGVAVEGQYVYVCFQRRWSGLGDPSNRVRIGRFDTLARTWGFAYYALELPISPNGGWVGLSELSSAGNGRFVVIERDDQGGPDAALKRLYEFSIAGLNFADHSQTPAFDTVAKTLVFDVLAQAVYAPYGGLTPEKQEGLALLPNGDVLLVNDNDGVDDNNGETLLIRLEGLLD